MLRVYISVLKACGKDCSLITFADNSILLVPNVSGVCSFRNNIHQRIVCYGKGESIWI